MFSFTSQHKKQVFICRFLPFSFTLCHSCWLAEAYLVFSPLVVMELILQVVGQISEAGVSLVGAFPTKVVVAWVVADWEATRRVWFNWQEDVWLLKNNNSYIYESCQHRWSLCCLLLCTGRYCSSSTSQVSDSSFGSWQSEILYSSKSANVMP